MNINVSVKYKDKKIKEELDFFADKVVYNVAVLTREMTKSLRAFPRLTGNLELTEVQSHIVGHNREYGLTAGVNYANLVWKMGNKTQWTNKNTQPKWYYSVYDKNTSEILNNAVNRTLKEL